MRFLFLGYHEQYVCICSVRQLPLRNHSKLYTLPHTFFFRTITDNTTSQNIDLYFWIILYVSILSFRRVLYVVCFLLGISSASEV